MAVMASLCFDGPAMEWFERLDDEVHTDWSLLRRALLERFPTSDVTQDTSSPHPVFTGNTPKECKEFVRDVRKHTHSEGRTRDDEWTADYAGSCMAGEALKWHAKLQAPIRNSWTQLERTLLADFS